MEFFDLNIYAVVIANNIYGLVVCILNDIALKKYTSSSQNIEKTYIIPAISSLVMGVSVYVIYKLCYTLLHSNAVSTIFSIVVGVAVYGILLLKMKGLTENELMRMPKGNLIVSLCKKFHLI